MIIVARSMAADKLGNIKKFYIICKCESERDWTTGALGPQAQTPVIYPFLESVSPIFQQYFHKLGSEYSNIFSYGVILIQSTTITTQFNEELNGFNCSWEKSTSVKPNRNINKSQTDTQFRPIVPWSMLIEIYSFY